MVSGLASRSMQIEVLVGEIVLQDTLLSYCLSPPRCINVQSCSGLASNTGKQKYSKSRYRSWEISTWVPVYGPYIILSIFTYLFSFEWCRVCRVPVYELYFPLQIFHIRTSFPEFILANIVILSSNVNCKQYCKQSCVFVRSPWLDRLGNHSPRLPL